MKDQIAILFICLATWSFANSSKANSNEYTIKVEAFEILNQKCNTCHSTENKDRVFTLENMDKNAKRIKRQVFFFKRMPKGDDIKLTEKEKDILKNWINSIN